MEDLFFVLLLISTSLLILGLISPRTSLFWIRSNRTRGKSSLIYGLATLLFFIAFGEVSNNKGDANEEVTELPDDEEAEGIPQDTVYAGNITSREKMESKVLTIQLDNGAGKMPGFVVGDTSLLRIRIPRFMEYDMYIEEVIGASIIKIDTSRNRYLVVPDSIQFSFVLKQYYPKGRVIIYSRNWNEDKGAYDVKITPSEGMTEVSEFAFKAR